MKFQTAYEETRDSVYGYLLYMTRDKQLAQDLSQETFLKMFLHMGKFRGEASVKTWALTIARNVFLSYARKKQPVLMEELPLEAKEVPFSNLPEEIMLRREKEEQVRECLQYLGELERTVLLLRDYEQLSYEEMATILETSTEALKSRLYRARQKFKKIYTDRYSEEP